MNILITILITILATAILAYVIVKFVPLKLRWLISVILVGLAGFLGYKIYLGVMNPIKFRIEKEIRYAKVINQLKLIRDAEVRYKQVNRIYTDNESTLMTFINQGKIAITESKNVEKTVKLGGGITKKISVKKIDTIGYEPVLKYFKGKNINNLFSVPGTNKKFQVQIATVEKVKDLFVPVFEAKINKKDVLSGMNENEIKQEIIARETSEVKGENISVGSLDEVSVSGNWPPMYDKKSEK